MSDERPTVTAFVARLREDGHESIAVEIENGRGETLTDNDLALVDSLVYGFGVLVSGKRVSPLDLKLVTYEAAG
jgi:hypothetical protein